MMFAMALSHFTLSEGQSCETWKNPTLHGSLWVTGSVLQLLAASLRALHRNISAEIHPSQVPPERGKTVSVRIKSNIKKKDKPNFTNKGEIYIWSEVWEGRMF